MWRRLLDLTLNVVCTMHVSVSRAVCMCPIRRDAAFFIVRNVFVGKIFIIVLESESLVSSRVLVNRAQTLVLHYTSYLVLSIETYEAAEAIVFLRICLRLFRLFFHWPGFCHFVFIYILPDAYEWRRQIKIKTFFSSLFSLVLSSFFGWWFAAFVSDCVVNAARLPLFRWYVVALMLLPIFLFVLSWGIRKSKSEKYNDDDDGKSENKIYPIFI